MSAEQKVFSHTFVAQLSGYPCEVKYDRDQCLWQAFVTIPWDHPDFDYYVEENPHVPWMVEGQEVVYHNGTTVWFDTSHHAYVPGFFTILT